VPVVLDRHFFVRGTPLGKFFFGRQSCSVHPREHPPRTFADASRGAAAARLATKTVLDFRSRNAFI
jgi:hypothetical protein